MPSSLYGLYSAQRSLSLNQAAIDLINNNVANINTPGYSKQRAEISQQSSGNISTEPINAAQDSMGATIDAISRNREVYIDNYYRTESADFNYYKELAENASFIEDITNELDNTGINSSLDAFYQALSQLSSNPDNYVTRNNVVQKATELTTKLNSVYSRLENLRTNLVGDPDNSDTLSNSKIKIAADDLNDKLNQVATLNNSIILSTAQGSSPNHLLDKRDLLLDEISERIPANIEYQTNGAANITLGSTSLVSGNTQTGFFDVAVGDADNPALLQIDNAVGGTLVSNAYSITTSGQMGAILEMGGSEANKLTIKSVMDDLNTLASELASEINTLQLGGQYIDSSADPHVLDSTNMYNIFVDDSGTTANITAGNITLDSNIVSDPFLIAAADSASAAAETGDGSNALAMSQIRNSLLSNLGGSTTEQYVTKIVGEIGSKAATIQDNFDTKESITQQIKMKRESVTGVNLDEELTDLIRFQRAYEASARILTVVDQNIKTIIGMAR